MPGIDMSDAEHPVIRQLVERGYKISFHAHVLGEGTMVAFIATHGTTKRSFSTAVPEGRPRCGVG